MTTGGEFVCGLGNCPAQARIQTYTQFTTFFMVIYYKKDFGVNIH